MNLQQAETTLYSLSDAAPAAPSERRTGDRQMTLYRVGSLSIADQRELCLIKNISAGGMMVRAYCSVAEGTRVAVELKCGQPILGAISWARDFLLGIKFDEPIDVIDILSSASGPRQRMPRIEVDRMIFVREGATTYRMVACDISQGGMKVECETCLPAGSDVVVTLAGMTPQPGVVRWATDSQMGITFNERLSLPTLVAWIHDQPALRQEG